MNNNNGERFETSYVEKQFLRSRELFTNSPLALVRAGDNNASSFSFEIVKEGEDAFVIKDWHVAGEEMEYAKIKGRLNDTLDTPVGKLVVAPTMLYDDLWKRNSEVFPEQMETEYFSNGSSGNKRKEIKAKCIFGYK